MRAPAGTSQPPVTIANTPIRRRWVSQCQRVFFSAGEVVRIMIGSFGEVSGSKYRFLLRLCAVGSKRLNRQRPPSVGIPQKYRFSASVVTFALTASRSTVA